MVTSTRNLMDVDPAAICLPSPAQRQGACADVLEAVTALNQQFLELLCECAGGANHAFPLPQDLRMRLSQLEPTNRIVLANSRVSLLDAGFANLDEWSSDSRLHSDRPEHECWLTSHLAHTLVHSTFVLAWYSLRTHMTAARVTFGMTRECARVISELNPATLARIARENPHRVRPRWERQPEVWSSLLDMATRAEPDREYLITLRGLQVST
jgi:hypothetical protein